MPRGLPASRGALEPFSRLGFVLRHTRAGADITPSSTMAEVEPLSAALRQAAMASGICRLAA